MAGYSVDDEYYFSTVFIFLRTIANRLAMFDDDDDVSFQIPAGFWPTKYADLFFLEFPSEQLKQEAEQLDSSVVEQLKAEVEVEMKEEEEKKASSGKNGY